MHGATMAELHMDNWVTPGTVVPPTYDPHCSNNEITEGCEPMAIISGDVLRDIANGPAESAKIAQALLIDSRTGQYVIEQETWECIWNELLVARVGPKMVDDRPGYETMYTDYNFSAEMLLTMIDELNRLIAKYNSGDWLTKPTAVRLVEILQSHIALLEVELNEVNTGQRMLTKKDFLGPGERARMLERETGEAPKKEKVDHSRYFMALEQQRLESKHREMRERERLDREKAENKGNSVASDAGLIEALSNALSQIRTLETIGGMDQETASSLFENIRKVALEANFLEED